MTLPGLFVVGTDTGVGKTRVASAIVASLAKEGRRVGVLKPLASGAFPEGSGWRCEDTDLLVAAAGRAIPFERVTPFVFEEPLAPSVAARRTGRPLTRGEVIGKVGEAVAWWSQNAEILVVEGVGGWLTPVAERTTVADLAVVLDFPVVVVARRGLGTLNHTLLTVESIRTRGLRVAGVVLNQAEPGGDGLAEATNGGELARWLDGIAVLAEVSYDDNRGTIPFEVGSVDWYDRSLRPRPSDSLGAARAWSHGGRGGD